MPADREERVPVKDSTCGDTSGLTAVKCGCVNTGSPVSLASAGLLNGSVHSQTAYRTYQAPGKGPVGSILGFFTGLVNKKTDLSTADPRAYTRDTAQVVTARATGVCPADLFRTTLVFADQNSAFINTGTGNQDGTFTWDSIDPRVRTVVWQVSIFPFPATGNNWSAVPGLLAQGNLDGDQHTFTIDFSKSVPTAGDAALVWGNKPAFLRVEKTMLTTLKTGLLAGESGTAGQTPGPFAATRQKQEAGIDSAVATLNQKISGPASFTLAAPSKYAGFVSPVSMAAGSAGVQGKGTAGLPRTYTAKAGVLAPVLNLPAITKQGLAGTLPQTQRTLFVRVVPFDQNGNYTGNPSNTKEVVVGEPRYNITSPWSGWGALSGPDPSGVSNPPEMVNFGDRLYLFGVRSDNLVSMSSIGATGSSTGWTQVPGSPPVDKSISAVVYEREGALGSSPKPHLYLFATRQDTGLAWYTRMDSDGAWSAWAPVPQKDTAHSYTLEKAISHNGYLYLLARYDYRSAHPNDQSYSHTAVSYVYQQMDELGDTLGNLQWMNDWQDTGAPTGSAHTIAGAGDIGFVDAYQDLSGQSHFIVYAYPSSQKSCAYCSPTVTMPVKQKIDVPPAVLAAQTSPADLTASSYHGRLYYFVRGNAGHIFMAWQTIMVPMVAAGPEFGNLSGWADISPDRMAADPGITALASPDGDRLDVLADNIQPAPVEHTGLWGAAVNTISVLFPPKSTGMNRDSLGAAPADTQLLRSVSGDKITSEVDSSSVAYILNDANVSWTRTTPVWFAWNTSQPVLYDAEWQVSTLPFDEINPKFYDNGIIAQGRLNAGGTDPDYVTESPGTSGLPGYAGKVHLFPVDLPSFATHADPANPSVTRYYVRVVAVAPTGTPGTFTAYPSEQMEVDWAPPQPPPQIIACTPPTVYTYTYTAPKITIVGYTPIQPMAPDASCHVIVTTGHTYWKNWYLQNGNPNMLLPLVATGDPNKDADTFATRMVGPVEYGWWEYLCAPSQHSDSWWDDFVNGIEDLVSFAASLVDNFADAYAMVKSAVISSVCGGNGPCVAVMSTGVDAGLAALGVPPSMPNFNTLMNDGADYLAGTIADEYGVPVDDAGDIVDVAKSIHGVATGLLNVPTPGDPYGLQPDPAYQYQPARLMIQLENDDPVNATPPGQIRVDDDWKLFRTTQPDTPFPSLRPGQTMTFPLLLEENQWQDTTCTECMGNQCDNVPCDDWSAEGDINSGWWDTYQYLGRCRGYLQPVL